MASRKAYQEVRDLIGAHGGSMRFVREGYQYGAWIVRLHGKRRVFLSNGSGYPEIDGLYVPKPEFPVPTHWSDYTNTLVSGAWEKLENLLG